MYDTSPLSSFFKMYNRTVIYLQILHHHFIHWNKLRTKFTNTYLVCFHNRLQSLDALVIKQTEIITGNNIKSQQDFFLIHRYF